MRHALIALALLSAASPARAAEEMRCRFERALLASDQLVDVRQSVLITAERHQARVRVTRKGSWGALRRPRSDGGSDITFDTAETRETISVDRRGNARWAITANRPAGANSIVGYSGRCGDWRVKR